MFKKRDVKGIVQEYLPWLLIALGVLVIVVLAMFILKDKGIAIIDRIRGLSRGR